jgi:hypothetical protein
MFCFVGICTGNYSVLMLLMTDVNDWNIPLEITLELKTPLIAEPVLAISYITDLYLFL